MRMLVSILTVFSLALSVSFADRADKLAKRKARVDDAAVEAMERLMSEHPGAESLLGRSFGYAVFSNLKVAVGVSGGGGSGVAIDRSSGERTYMRMSSAGVGFGLGGQRYHVVFFFETQEAFDRFVEKGWQADASAQAAAGKDGANARSSFHDGIAVFQLTKKGLLASADVTGTKYWKDDELNE